MPSAPEVRGELGMMGTIPLYWGESAGVEEALSQSTTIPWAREQLEKSFVLRPLDTLDTASLEGLDGLILAQPRALAPSENVALDDWVRAGGALLLFADPMMTAESRFPIGDRRRPQDVVLLSPILTRWGLQMHFEAEAPQGVAQVSDSGPPIPVNRPGVFTLVAGEGACATLAGNVLARCTIGKGRVVILADAAVLDLYDPQPEAAAALAWLVADAFPGTREITGQEWKCGKTDRISGG